MAVTAGKADIVDVVAEKTGMTKKDAADVLEATLEAITEALQRS